MAGRAKLFKSGGSQAVRLPKGYRFEGQDEVVIYRVGSRVVLEPKRREWSRDFLELAGTAKDFPYPSRQRQNRSPTSIDEVSSRQ